MAFALGPTLTQEEHAFRISPRKYTNDRDLLSFLNFGGCRPRRPDAEAVLSEMKRALGDASAYQYAAIYAQCRNRVQALEWLDTALRLRDPDLVELKTDPATERLRQEPRFKAIVRELKFPPT